MAKFSLVFGVTGVLLLLAMAATVSEASTIFTTTTVKENTHGTVSEGCTDPRKPELDFLKQCALYVSSFYNPGFAETYKKKCCMDLKTLPQECMCPGLQDMVYGPTWKTLKKILGEFDELQLSILNNLPERCGLMSEQCVIEVPRDSPRASF